MIFGTEPRDEQKAARMMDIELEEEDVVVGVPEEQVRMSGCITTSCGGRRAALPHRLCCALRALLHVRVQRVALPAVRRALPSQQPSPPASNALAPDDDDDHARPASS